MKVRLIRPTYFVYTYLYCRITVQAIDPIINQLPTPWFSG
jgi:hypothetical protein